MSGGLGAGTGVVVDGVSAGLTAAAGVLAGVSDGPGAGALMEAGMSGRADCLYWCGSCTA